MITLIELNLIILFKILASCNPTYSTPFNQFVVFAPLEYFVIYDRLDEKFLTTKVKLKNRNYHQSKLNIFVLFEL